MIRCSNTTSLYNLGSDRGLLLCRNIRIGACSGLMPDDRSWSVMVGGLWMCSILYNILFFNLLLASNTRGESTVRSNAFQQDKISQIFFLPPTAIVLQGIICMMQFLGEIFA
ncbi:hypothetical protein SJDPG2_05255 [Porphyromonas gingivalis SJD2]|nr:hypothetical protein SJDPG2_05255 [Porphyromonas gingivalis SJD2]OWR77808.1 hypothetical protein SJDPG5_05845 [Porphyromonas gingivalis SJD5]